MTSKRSSTSVKAASRPLWRRRWPLVLAVVFGLPALIGSALLGYYYVRVAGLIDARLHGQRERMLPRVYGRPMELRRGQALSER